MNTIDPDIRETTASKTKDEVREPSMYKVFLLNDDYTTMDFVIEVLMAVFSKTVEDASSIMLRVHREGTGLCGAYILEVAETKVSTVHNLARENGFPLKCSMEKA